MGETQPRIRWRRWLGVALVVLIMAVVAGWAQSYYSKKFFYLDDAKYFKYEDSGSGTIEYRAAFGRGNPVVVHARALERVIETGGESYLVRGTEGLEGEWEPYAVVYPAGTEYRVEPFGQDGFQVFDQAGEWVLPPAVMHVGLGNKIRDPDSLRYFPADIAAASDEAFHQPNGGVGFFLLAVALFIFNWCGFRYEAFQRFLFHISPSNLMVSDPEPSDFYFFMCKVGGVLGMVVSLGIFFAHAL